MTHDDVVKHYAQFLEYWNSNATVARAFIDDEQSMLVLKMNIRDGFSHDTEHLSFLLELFDRDLNEFMAEIKPLSINEVRALTGKEPIVYEKEVKSPSN